MQVSTAVLLIAASGCAIAAGNEDSDTKRYFTHTFGVGGLAKSATSAGIAHVQNTPSEWGHGAVGFGKRFASAFGFHIIKKSIELPVVALHHEEYGYHPSHKEGAKARLLYALASVVITHKRTTGARTVNAGELSGDIGAGLLSRLWQPASTRSFALGFSSAGTTLAIDAGYNVVREFWPEIRHPRSRKTQRRDTATLRKEEENAEPEISEQDREVE
jgi:hypothetical protein